MRASGPAPGKETNMGVSGINDGFVLPSEEFAFDRGWIGGGAGSIESFKNWLIVDGKIFDHRNGGGNRW